VAIDPVDKVDPDGSTTISLTEIKECLEVPKKIAGGWR
jgi:hypothetical protein